MLIFSLLQVMVDFSNEFEGGSYTKKKKNSRFFVNEIIERYFKHISLEIHGCLCQLVLMHKTDLILRA